MNKGGSILLLSTVLLLGSHVRSVIVEQSIEESMSMAGKLIRYEELKHQSLPLSGEIHAALSSLDYAENELPFIYINDLNGDGSSDYLLGSSKRSLCSTAGCPYLLLDGSSLKIIGDFFGTVAVLNRQIHQFPVIQTLSGRDITATNLHTFVFDGKTYRLVCYALLESQGIDEWYRGLNSERTE